MIYEPLGKLYYKDKETFEAEYNNRKNGGYSYSLGLKIHDNEAFFVYTPVFTNISARIYKKFSQLLRLCMELPEVAYNSYETKCLVDEIILSNDIEGIRSTRKEVIDVLETDSQSGKKKRLEGMVRKYVLLLDNQHYEAPMVSSQHLRNLYDEIVLDEIDKVNWPDGEIFRKYAAEVISGTQQVKHVGLVPEEKIIHYMDSTLALFKDDNVPMLCKTAILHYMVGYVHPFYDGNGRLSRFMSSYLLKSEFNSLVALRLSYTIKNSKNEYYKAFDIINDPHNMGDLTPFILYFADVVEKSVDSLTERLTDGAEKLKFYARVLREKYGGLEYKEKKKTSDVLWLLIQNKLFTSEPFDKKSLAKELGVNAETAHNYVYGLSAAGAPVTIAKNGKKFIYLLDLSGLQSFLEK